MECIYLANNKVFNGSGALRAAGEWLAPFYPPAVLAHPPLKNGVMCANNAQTEKL